MFINGTICGDSTIEIFEVAEIQNAKKGSITFLGNNMYNKYLETTSASAIIVSDEKLIKENKIPKVKFFLLEIFQPQLIPARKDIIIAP